MTTLVEQLQTLLNPLVAGGAWYGVNTSEFTQQSLPYLIFTRTSKSNNNTLAGPSDLQNSTVQIDVFSETVSGLEALSSAVSTAMLGAPFTNLPLSSHDMYEEAVRLFRRSFTYSIWSTN